jgi:diguanylate cyclase (GGDEF)-like protein
MGRLRTLTWYLERASAILPPREARHALVTAVVFGIAVFASISLTRNATTVAAVWPANGIMLAALLTCPTARARHATLALCFIANLLAHLVNGDPVVSALAFPLINVFEALLAFCLIRHVLGTKLDFSEVRTVIWFAAIAGFAAPFLPAVAGAGIAAAVQGAPFGQAFETWLPADGLGMLVITPAYILMTSEAQDTRTPSPAHLALHFGLLALVSVAVFSQSHVPLLFLIIPISVFLAFRLGSRYAAIATLLLTVFSLACTYQGLGPAAMISEEHAEARIWLVQLFCFVNLFTSLAVAAAVAEGNRLRADIETMSAFAAESRRQLDAALDCMSQGICLFDAAGRVVMRNDRFLSIYGLDSSAVPIGLPYERFAMVCQSAGISLQSVSGASPLGTACDVHQALSDGRHIKISQRLLADGGVICTYTDITIDKRAEEELLHLTLHDALTELPNRRLLCERMERAFNFARRGTGAAVMLLDIDHFKSINDTCGHQAGDELLKLVAARLKAAVREIDTVARLGGDEFAILLANTAQPDEAAIVAKRILASMQEATLIEGKSIKAGLSIGIAVAPHDGATQDEILKAADRALYKAKLAGRNTYAFYCDPAVLRLVAEALRLSLKGGIKRRGPRNRTGTMG